jgi:hypothetical protein
MFGGLLHNQRLTKTGGGRGRNVGAERFKGRPVERARI